MGIDAVRGIAMWMVVVAHFALWFFTCAPERYPLSLPGQMIALPVFFFVSARMRRNLSWHHLAKRAIRFALITIIGTALLDVVRQVPIAQVLEPENLFFWFLVALIIFEATGTAILHLINRIQRTSYRLITAVALIIAVQVLFMATYRIAPELPVVPLFDLRTLWLSYALGLLCTVSPALIRLLRSIAVFIAALTVLTGACILTDTTGDRIFIIGTIASVITSCRTAEMMKSASFAAIAGRRSLGIYIIHPFLLTLIYHLVNQYLKTLVSPSWAIYAICVAGAAVVCAVIALPLHRFAMWRKKLKFARQ